MRQLGGFIVGSTSGTGTGPPTSWCGSRTRRSDGASSTSLGSHGKITIWQEGAVFIARTKFRDLDGVVRFVKRNGKTKATAERALKAVEAIGECPAIGWSEVDLDEQSVDVCWRLVRRTGVGLLRRPAAKTGAKGERVSTPSAAGVTPRTLAGCGRRSGTKQP